MDFLWEMADEVRKTGSYSAKDKDKGRENPDDAQRLEEMLACGTTCFADMYFEMDRVAEAALQSAH